MAPKKTDRKQKIDDLRRELIASRHECAMLRRELEEIRSAALTVIATFQRDTHDTMNVTVD